ncbi:MAG: hypothetical protein V3V88_03540 [Dehalococcoidia bacterium]
MGSLVPLIAPAVTGFAIAKGAQAIAKPPKPVQAPQVPQAIAPPSATVNTQQAQDQARKRTTSGRAETFITGDLVPEKKKKTLLG